MLQPAIQMHLNIGRFGTPPHYFGIQILTENQGVEKKELSLPKNFFSDYLDNGNNKKALQEADKVLKKQLDFPCCKVLKALALMRMGREDEAQPLIDSVLDESPTDESTLQAMNIAFKELQQRKGHSLMTSHT